MEVANMKKSDFIRSRGMRFPKDGRIIQGRIRGSLRQETYERKEADAALRNVRAGDVDMGDLALGCQKRRHEP
ncbi:MAG: hypothetical protein AAFV87_04925, partial [Pseudomonadota bacterium]